MTEDESNLFLVKTSINGKTHTEVLKYCEDNDEVYRVKPKSPIDESFDLLIHTLNMSEEEVLLNRLINQFHYVYASLHNSIELEGPLLSPNTLHVIKSYLHYIKRLESYRNVNGLIDALKLHDVHPSRLIQVISALI